MEEMTEGQRLFRDVVDAAGALADMAKDERAPEVFAKLYGEVRTMVDKMLVMSDAEGNEPILVGAVTVMELVIKTAGAALKDERTTPAGLQRTVEIVAAIAVQRIDELTRV